MSATAATSGQRAGPGGALSRAALAVEDELGTAIILGLQRLAQQSTLYDAENEALRRQLEHTLKAVGDYSQTTGRNVSVVFSDRAVYVGRRLLRASRSVYAVADELRALLARMGATEITIDSDVTEDDLRVLLGAFRDAIRGRSSEPPGESSRIRLRRGRPPSEHAAFDGLSEEEQIVKTVALAVVIVRRFLEAVQRGKLEIPGHLRQVTRQLVLLSERAGPTFLRVTAGRSVHDDATRAVNAALLGLGMARQLTDDPRVLSRIALAALFYHVGQPRAAGIDPTGDPLIGTHLPRLGIDQLETLPGATAAVLVALGRMTDAGMSHAVMVYEALYLNHRALLAPPYGGAQAPATSARIIACAHRFQELLSDPDIGETSADIAIATLASEARDDTDKAVLRLLMAALRIFPRGTWVELSTGERAVVVAVPPEADDFPRPRVRLLPDSSASGDEPMRELDLRRPHAGGPPPHIVQVLQAPDRASPPAAPTMAVAGRPAEAAVTAPPIGSERITFKPPRDDGGERVTAPPTSRPDSLPREFDGTDDEIVIPVGPSGPVSALSAPSGPLVSIPPPPSQRTDAASTDATGTTTEPLGAAPPRDQVPTPMARPTAQGTLKKTPLTHLLVYALDRRLTGSTLIVSPTHDRCVIHFHGGAPSKVRVPDMVAPLDRTLQQMGALDETTLHETCRRVAVTKQLHGRLLVEDGLIDEHTLQAALERQLVEKVRYMFGLPPETRYGYYEGLDLLAGYGAKSRTPCEPLALIMMGVRMDRQKPAVDAVLQRLAQTRLTLHAAADATRLGLENEELRAVELLQQEPLTLEQLIERSAASRRQVELTVYGLVITRHIDLSDGTRQPVGLG